MRASLVFFALVAALAAVQARSLTADAPAPAVVHEASVDESPNVSPDASPDATTSAASLGDDPNAAGVAVTLPSIDGTFYTGDGTAYSDTIQNASTFACALRTLPTWSKSYFVAINNDQWNDGYECGRCVRAKCIDSRCPIQNVEVVAMVVDKCPECLHGAIDFSYPAYSAVTGLWPHRMTVTWEFVDCGGYNDLSITAWPMTTGGNQWWQAFYLSGQRYPLESVTLAGQSLIRDQFGFWQHSGEAPTDAEIVITDMHGNTVTSVLSSIWSYQDLGIQLPLSTVAAAGRK